MRKRSNIVSRDQSELTKRVMRLVTGNPIFEDASPIAGNGPANVQSGKLAPKDDKSGDAKTRSKAAK